MGFQNFISYKFLTDTKDIKIEQFSYLAIKNQGVTDISLTRGDDGEKPTAKWTLKKGEPFSFPLQGAPYDIVKLAAGGAEYSIMTDGLITEL